MADKPTPTDAEILDAAEDFRSRYTHGGTTFDEFDEIGFTRAVLAKWGTPTPPSDSLTGLLKEARKIIRASSSRNLTKDWDARATRAIATHHGETK